MKMCQASFILGIVKWAVVFEPVEGGGKDDRVATCAKHRFPSGISWEVMVL